MNNINPKAFLVNDLRNVQQIPTRNGYGEGLLEAAKKNKNIIALCADLTDSTKTKLFKDNFPERFIEMGVAEQNMAAIASGLAKEGKIPFIASYGMFSPGRNWEQLRTTICYSNRNVKIIGCHTGVSVGPDGATHQAIEDIAITRVLPNMVVLAPCDYIEAKKATIAAANYIGPVYIRYGREPTPVITTDNTPFSIGNATIFKDGKDLSIIACGQIVYYALLAAEKLEQQGINAQVINCPSIKPLDKKTILKATQDTGAIVTAEEHQIYGGLGSCIIEFISQSYPVPVQMVGVNDRFGESGTQEELLKKFNLIDNDIEKAAKRVLKLKQGKHKLNILE